MYVFQVIIQSFLTLLVGGLTPSFQPSKFRLYAKCENLG